MGPRKIDRTSVQKPKKKPATKPPPKDQNPFGGNAYGVRSRSKTTTITGADEGEVGGYEWMRLSAATQYVTNLKGLSIRDVGKIPPFDQLAGGTLERWSLEDEWSKRRQKYFQDIREEIESRLAEKLVKTRVDQLGKVDSMIEELIPQVSTIEAKSKEGLITALVRLMGAGDDLRDKIAKEVVPAHLGGVQQETLPMVPKLSEEEARDAARAVLKRRRIASRQKVRAERQEAQEQNLEKKPKLHIVKGQDDG